MEPGPWLPIGKGLGTNLLMSEKWRGYYMWLYHKLEVFVPLLSFLKLAHLQLQQPPPGKQIPWLNRNLHSLYRYSSWVPLHIKEGTKNHTISDYTAKIFCSFFLSLFKKKCFPEFAGRNFVCFDKHLNFFLSSRKSLSNYLYFSNYLLKNFLI